MTVGVVVEPLDRKHDRAAFSCGEARIDNFIKLTATRQVKDDDCKVYVAVAPPTTRVLGFFSLLPHAIDIQSLPEADQKRMPRQPTVSAIYLSMVAVDATEQGKGIGTFLMAEMFKKCVMAADIIGGHFLVLDALNEDAARLYRRLGFVDLLSQPNRMLIAMTTVRKAVAAAAAAAAAAAPAAARTTTQRA